MPRLRILDQDLGAVDLLEDILRKLRDQQELQRRNRLLESRLTAAVEEIGELLVIQALAAEELQEEVTRGQWEGFTKGEAIAWNWNLFQYELQGASHPKAQLRMESLKKLRAGLIPETFDYPQRARELVEQGVTPLSYREHQRALGRRILTDLPRREK